MKYRVLKECVYPVHVELVEKGDIIELEGPCLAKDKIILCGMVEHGFLEPIEEPKVELSGQYVPEGEGDYCIPIIDRTKTTAVWRTNRNSEVTKNAASLGMSFKTEKECQKWINKMKAYQILRQDAKGFEPNWTKYAQKKWSGIYNHVYEELEAVWSGEYQDMGVLYFASKEDIEKSFKAHRKEWLTVLGVEE